MMFPPSFNASSSVLLPLWYLLSSITASFSVLLIHFFPSLNLYECIFSSVPIGFLFSSWFVFLFCGIYGEATIYGTYVATLLQTYLTSMYFNDVIEKLRSINSKSSSKSAADHRLLQGHTGHKTSKQQKYERLADQRFLRGLAFFSFAFFGYFFSTHTLEEDESGLHTVGACYGDLPFHLNIINSFRHGANKRFQLWSIRNPLYAGSPLAYPIIADFHSAILTISGFTIKDSIIIPSILLGITFLPLLFLFGLKFLSHPEASLVSVFLTVFSGGTGFVSFFLEDKLSWKGFLEGDFVQRTTSGQDLFWMNLTSSILLPQRAALYGYSAFLAIILMLHTAYQSSLFNPTLPSISSSSASSSSSSSTTTSSSSSSSSHPSAGPSILHHTVHTYLNTQPQSIVFVSSITRVERKKLFALAGILTGLLPLAHAQSFIAVIVISLSLCIFDYWKLWNDSPYFYNWLGFFVPIVVLVLPQWGLFFNGDDHYRHFLRWSPMWSDQLQDPISFWFGSLGLFVFLSLLFVVYVEGKQRKFYYSFLVLFLVANFIQVQPWKRDNIKLFYCWFFGAAHVTALGLHRIGSRQGGLRILVVFVITSLMLSSILGLAREFFLRTKLLDDKDVECGVWIMQNTSPNAIFLGSDSHINVISSIAGRTQVMGYNGWLWAHGIDFTKRAEEVKQMLLGDASAKQLLKNFNVAYILKDWKLNNPYYYTTNHNFLAQLATEVYNDGKYSILKVNNVD